ncbi:FAD-dependent oxidoreductase [Marinimicrobium alkaliphilum]|uniref:FAD-dependent oxidoreductase n=1 Tax=Marinimicrobium alkaliphilum TaxID=2202654 RepID=UPI000DB90219|nr:FAD-dependent oxidoreductase [Marinimicrobium alkaliphilum]
MAQRIVLAGAGHAHLEVLKALAERPLADAHIVLINPSRYVTYSGRVPGWMAGHYDLAQCRIDLLPLVRAAGVELLEQPVAGMDADRDCVACPGIPPIEYDWLSLNVGGETDVSWFEAAEPLLLPVRPLAEFAERWQTLLAQAERERAFRLRVVGAGAAGVELALAAQHRLCSLGSGVAVSLITSAQGLLPGHGGMAVRALERELRARKIALVRGPAAGTESGVLLPTGESLPADGIILATGRRPPCWLSLSRLALDEEDHVQVDAQQRSLSHANVFAVGDICQRVDRPLAHSGVHAVMGGKVLAHNLRAAAQGGAYRPYRPKPRSLYLLGLGDQRALASWGPLAARGRWAWRWKQRIDERYMASLTFATKAGRG